MKFCDIFFHLCLFFFNLFFFLVPHFNTPPSNLTIQNPEVKLGTMKSCFIKDPNVEKSWDKTTQCNLPGLGTERVYESYDHLAKVVLPIPAGPQVPTIFIIIFYNVTNRAYSSSVLSYPPPSCLQNRLVCLKLLCQSFQ